MSCLSEREGSVTLVKPRGVCKRGLLSVGLVVVLASVAWAERLVVDNFDDGAVPNLLGGDYGAWNRYPDDDTQGCQTAAVPSDAAGTTGSALRLTYDVDSPNAAYCGFWSKLPGLDLRSSQRLVLSLRGDAAAGFTTQLKVELKHEALSPEGEPDAGAMRYATGQHLLKGVTGVWQSFAIPLDAMTGLSDRSRVVELVILVDDMTSTKKTGTLYLDDIAFE